MIKNTRTAIFASSNPNLSNLSSDARSGHIHLDAAPQCLCDAVILPSFHVFLHSTNPRVLSCIPDTPVVCLGFDILGTEILQ
jgi:hypothetical protein